MPKMDNPHGIRMTNSIREQVGEQAAAVYAEKYPLSKSASYQKKFKWIEDSCRYLEENYDDRTIRKIREVCNCEDGSTKAKKMRMYLNSTASIIDFVEMFNLKEDYASIELNEGRLLLIYPECYCSCVKRVDKLVSKTWCYCTVGYTKSLFEKAFDRVLDVELLESIKTGGNRCVIAVDGIVSPLKESEHK